MQKTSGSPFSSRAFVARAACLFFLTFAPQTRVLAQDTGSDPGYQDERKKAMDLYDSRKLLEALPLLDYLASLNPKDPVVHERWGVALLAQTAGEPDAAKRKQMRLHVRQIFIECKQLGDNSPLLNTLLGSLPADGSEAPFSPNPEVDTAMRVGEAAYTRGDFDAAVTAYQAALTLDPKLYNAAVFIGDSYFLSKRLPQAEQWFAKAVEIDPNQETAYRYWGDALLNENKPDDALEKFTDAIVANPYSVAVWNGLGNWARKQGVQAGHIRIDPPKVAVQQDGKLSINIDPSMLASKDGSSAWILYGGVRASWHAKVFAEQFPNEKEYRHSLREETAAYNAVAGNLEKGVAEHEFAQLTPALAALIMLKQQGLLEPYILLVHADAGIAQDYPAYRDAHRDKIRQYINTWVIAKPQLQTKF